METNHRSTQNYIVGFTHQKIFFLDVHSFVLTETCLPLQGPFLQISTHLPWSYFVPDTLPAPESKELNELRPLSYRT